MDALTGGDLFLFEGFRLDRQARALCRRNAAGALVPIAVGSRALEVLDVLVGRAGDLVSRDEFMSVVWPSTAVEDTNLNMQVAALRRILDEGRADGSCIQTIFGRGYRFAVPVTRVEVSAPLTSGRLSGNGAAGTIAKQPEPQHPATPSQSEKTPPIVPPRERKWPWRRSLAMATGVLVLVAAAAGWSWHSRWSGEARPVPRLSIVVLPFSNLSDDREQQYFADAVTEDLTTDLSRLADMLVISRNSAFTYKDKPVNAKQIGRELGVRYALEGSVQRSGSQVRVNVQLIDAETDAHLWAERFDRDIGDLFALQNEITGRIANTLSIELVGTEAARPTEHPDALDYILQGRAELSKPPTRDNYVEAIGLFERALALDPRSVAAQSRLASMLVSRVLDFGSSSADADIERAEELAAQAVAASPRSALAHFAKAQVLRVQRRCEQAIPEYETVLALNRNWVSALAAIGRCKIYVGPIEEAIPAQEQAIRLSPRDPQLGIWYYRIGEAHLLQSRNDEAVLWLEKARSANGGLWFVHEYLASAYALKGETERAAAELAEARRLSGDSQPWSVARFAANTRYETPAIRALSESTLFAGLRKAGMPED